MTRASLLRILDHVDGISDAEIRELEQLAAAFPYCQTAHVLLAKTAHDRGSMLAGQRLRRAATYAPDRELLRRLLERPVAVAEARQDARPAEVPPTAEPQTDPVAVTTTPPDGLAILAAAPKPAAAPETDLFAVEVDSPPPVLAADTEPAAAEPADHDLPTPPATPAHPQDTAAPETATEEEPTTVAAAPATTAVTEPTLPADTAVAGLPEETAAPAATASPATASPATAEATTGPQEPVATAAASTTTDEETAEAAELAQEPAAAENPAAPAAAPHETANAANATETADAAEELLPAVAPPIRPPEEAGISRFEFGFGEPRLPEPTGYRLPGIEEDDDDYAEEENALPTFRPAAPPRVTAPFRADDELGYALGSGSRLGYDLQTRTPDGFVLDLPLEAFFEPDALLLAHARAHQPVAKASSLDLIDRFLKAQPRIKTGTAGMPLPTTEQADLSVRTSTTAPPLASESLAKIMVRQGKTAKAIEIYERLMAKQPEKMAYFAQQIQQLQQPPE